MKQQPLELKHVLAFSLYIVITTGLILSEHGDKVLAYVKGLKL